MKGDDKEEETAKLERVQVEEAECHAPDTTKVAIADDEAAGDEVAFQGAPMAMEIGAAGHMSAKGHATSVFDEDEYSSSDDEIDTNPLATEMQAMKGHTLSTGGEPMSPVHPVSLANLALPVHYFVTGFVGAVCSGVLYGVLLGVMAVDAHVFVTSQTVVLAPWGVKCILAFISDAFPIMGYRRKYYCAIGHWISLFILVLLALGWEEPTPFHCMQKSAQGAFGYNDATVCNAHASDEAHVFVLALMLVVTGLVVADSAADGLMIETSQQQNDTKQRAAVPITCFMLRVTGGASGSLFLAIGFNGIHHLGFFHNELSLNTVCSVCAAACFISMVSWVTLSAADKPQSRFVPCSTCCAGNTSWNQHHNFSRCSHAKSQIRVLVNLFSSKRFFCFMMFNLLSPALANISTPVDAMMRRYWVNVQQLQQQVTTLITSLIYLAGLYGIRRCCFKLSWHTIVGVVTAGAVLFNVPISLLTAFGVYRNQYFFLVQDALDAFPSAAMYLVATLAVVELAPPGHEATLYGIVTTAHALAVPIARGAANSLYGVLPVWIGFGPAGAFSDESNYRTDDEAFRAGVAVSLCLAFTINLSALLLLPLLPKNQRAALAIRNQPDYRHHAMWGVLTLLILAVCFLSGFVLNVLAVIPTVNCTKWIGGAGCRGHP